MNLSDCLLVHRRTLCNSPKISSSWWSTVLWPPVKANGPVPPDDWGEQWGHQLHSWIKNVFKHKQISVYVLMTTTYALGCSIPASTPKFNKLLFRPCSMKVSLLTGMKCKTLGGGKICCLTKTRWGEIVLSMFTTMNKWVAWLCACTNN